MTRAGKCDTCRSRKVRCDEEKPKCGSCKKKDRACSYTYGISAALVFEDPKQLSKHGKARTRPIIHPLKSYSDRAPATARTMPSHQSAQKKSQETWPMSALVLRNERPRTSSASKTNTQPNAAPTPANLDLILPQPCSHETILLNRFLHMLGPQSVEHNPLSIYGTWISSLPARLGTSPVIDSAVEFAVNSFAAYRDPSFSKRSIAHKSRGRSLKELRNAVGYEKGISSYDTLAATKLQMTAEIFMGMETLYHTIHQSAMTEMLRQGNTAGIDDEIFSDFLEDTYMDDVFEAIIAGRTSIYDNETYLKRTYRSGVLACPSPDNPKALVKAASASVMHLCIQLPRLNFLTRHSVSHPKDAKVLASARYLAKSLWEAYPTSSLRDLLKTSFMIVPRPPFPEISDLLPTSFHFNSVGSLVLMTRYWMARNLLCGLIQTLYRHFPVQAELALLPELEVVQKEDINAAIYIARSYRHAMSVSLELPFVPLRVHGTLHASIGAWGRLIRRLTQDTYNGETEITRDLINAQRMEDWIVDMCDRIHDIWGVARLRAKHIKSAIEATAGEAIPEWIPTQVEFKKQGDEMVMKVQFDIPAEKIQEFYGWPAYTESWSRSTTSPSPFEVE
ncbi:hypothetical protein BDV95DRAFT_484801 [Massariosphaeria phaeospora]|uniref:Zn(2)-C6 fungal-type domain-containing protein n=1 Tax=Massariosphaeria phaeospora TaxID=100035 RepID=A0A7C8ICA9_9PLEO|nr:hypothetical protein BDV95DRAFT_484801 [Massariosphaeria phaeospora]